MTRRPNPGEWTQLSTTFPGLIWNDVWITGEPTAQYNCIGYSMGLFQWVNPRSPLAAFEQQYAQQGFAVAPANSATIDGWGKNGGTEMTHGSRQSTTMPQTALWESKLGQSFRITHGRNQLVSTIYGSVLTHFRPKAGMPGEPEGGSVGQYTADEYTKIADEAARVDPGLRASFNERLAVWKATWVRPDLAMSQNTYDRAEGPEYAAVVGLGDGIAPLVAEEIATRPDGIFLIPLLEEYTTPVPPESPVEGEQARGHRAVRAWLATR
jgi:hypothetical protein